MAAQSRGALARAKRWHSNEALAPRGGLEHSEGARGGGRPRRSRCRRRAAGLEGFATEEAANGCEALHLLKREHDRPDLILLDLMMPVMNGWAFREAQLADPDLATIPVVVMSAQDSSTIQAHAKLQKPFEIEQLLRAISTAPRARA